MVGREALEELGDIKQKQIRNILLRITIENTTMYLGMYHLSTMLYGKKK